MWKDSSGGILPDLGEKIERREKNGSDKKESRERRDATGGMTGCLSDGAGRKWWGRAEKKGGRRKLIGCRESATLDARPLTVSVRRSPPGGDLIFTS